ncbi:MAG TPA: peptidylprolyl isomerase [Fibrobacteraceae bacterium]|nr:peptidylprolyl isomerase [Fibrobacteraceae bacterium]
MFQKTIRSLAIVAFMASFAFSQAPGVVAPSSTGKIFSKDYTGIQSIKAVIKTHEGDITVNLDFKKAPNTVANFVDLAQKGFYNGTTFHRVIQRFMIQGGDPKGDGTGGPGYTIPFEKNDLKHEIGAISMANTGDPNSGGSQFFLVQWPQPHLDGKHTVFGKIESGLGVIYRIEPYDPIIKVDIVETRTP